MPPGVPLRRCEASDNQSVSHPSSFRKRSNNAFPCGKTFPHLTPPHRSAPLRSPALLAAPSSCEGATPSSIARRVRSARRRRSVLSRTRSIWLRTVRIEMYNSSAMSTSAFTGGDERQDFTLSRRQRERWFGVRLGSGTTPKRRRDVRPVAGHDANGLDDLRGQCTLRQISRRTCSDRVDYLSLFAVGGNNEHDRAACVNPSDGLGTGDPRGTEIENDDVGRIALEEFFDRTDSQRVVLKPSALWTVRARPSRTPGGRRRRRRGSTRDPQQDTSSFTGHGVQLDAAADIVDPRPYRVREPEALCRVKRLEAPAIILDDHFYPSRDAGAVIRASCTAACFATFASASRAAPMSASSDDSVQLASPSSSITVRCNPRRVNSSAKDTSAPPRRSVGNRPEVSANLRNRSVSNVKRSPSADSSTSQSPPIVSNNCIAES